MIILRSRSLATGLVVVLAACGSSDVPAKPARLHAPPLTPDLVATRGELQSEYYDHQVMLIDKWIKQSGISPRMATGLLDVVRESRDQKGRGRNHKHGLGGANADSTKFAAEAADAKTKALPLYEAALATDSTSRFARGARLARDRLASGQPLDHVRFFCFGE
jgi:hypothetical protein